MARIRKSANPPGERKKNVGRRQSILDADSRVRNWYAERSLRSRLSADTYARQLSLIAERLGMEPEAIVSEAKRDPDGLRVKLTGVAAALKKEGRLDSYVSKWFESLKSYLRFRRVPADVFPRLSATKGESLVNEYIPEPADLGRVLERLSIRGRVVALLMAHAGVRPGVIGSYGGEDGLRLRDLPDLKLGSTLTLKEVPFVVRVPAAISKTRAAYTTFGTSQLATALVAYLESRHERGERLTADSAVVASEPSRGVARRSQESALFSKGFLSTKSVVEELRGALKAVVPEGQRARPYVLRAYCSRHLLRAEGAGKITRDLREAILGHDLGIAGRYHLGKSWSPEMLKEARAAYKRCEAFLSTAPRAADGDRDLQTRKTVLRMFGYSEEELATADLSTKTDEELIQMADARRPKSAPAPARPGQKAVPLSEVGPLLDDGWEYVAPLGPDHAVLRGPGAGPRFQ
jgi:hypothetical protein